MAGAVLAAGLMALSGCGSGQSPAAGESGGGVYGDMLSRADQASLASTSADAAALGQAVTVYVLETGSAATTDLSAYQVPLGAGNTVQGFTVTAEGAQFCVVNAGGAYTTFVAPGGAGAQGVDGSCS